MASFSLVVDISTLAEFNVVKNTKDKKSVFFFWASWHEPSSPGGAIHTIIAALAEKYGSSISFYRVEAEGVPEVSLALGISVVPSFVSTIGSSVFQRVDGAKPQDLSKMVKSLAEASATEFQKSAAASASTVSSPITAAAAASATTASAPSSSSAPILTEQLRERIKGVLASSPVLLFMKGSPATPRCGFSRQMVELLQSNNIPFASFDILGDEEIRAGLKLYSDWPTYPQLYVASELIGGLDIVKEMVADSNTTLRSQLRIDELTSVPAAKPLNDRLHELINTAPVMLFMKGSPSAPRCGFSRTICQLLDSHNIVYGHFDILTDEEVRAGLKVYSDWPTYPQLYAKGNLVGGLDIVKEMAEQGPLAQQLELN